MSSDPIEVLREVYWAGWLNASTWANRDDQLDDRGSEAYKKLEGEAVQPALASLSAPKPPSVNDNAVAVNESPDANDKPESAEAVAWKDSAGDVWGSMDEVPSEYLPPAREFYPLVYADTAPPRPETSDDAADGGFTAADMMDARQEGRKEAQQPAAVDEAVVERVTNAVVAWATLPSDLPAEPEKVDELREVISAAIDQQQGGTPE